MEKNSSLKEILLLPDAKKVPPWCKKSCSLKEKSFMTKKGTLPLGDFRAVEGEISAWNDIPVGETYQ